MPHLTRRCTLSLAVAAAFALPVALAAPTAHPWRAATSAELAALLPARATVEKEHIETELRSASGITDGHGRFVAGVVLITAGYSADGKYSHFLMVQSPLTLNGAVHLAPGDYVLGWQRQGDSLAVRFFDSATGQPRGETPAIHIPGTTRVESFRLWPPSATAPATPTAGMLQVGRFGIPFHLD